MNTLTIRKASSHDLIPIQKLLSGSTLPIEGVSQHLQHFLVAEKDGAIVGTIGLEVYGDTGLLRSVAVFPELQNKGIGGRLLNTMLAYAKGQSVHRILLLTTTAQNYFHQKGFSEIDRTTVKGTVLNSTEFQGSCPSFAICMEKIL